MQSMRVSKLLKTSPQNPEDRLNGQLTWTRLPQGFKNSPIIFEEALHEDLTLFQVQEALRQNLQAAYYKPPPEPHNYQPGDLDTTQGKLQRAVRGESCLGTPNCGEGNKGIRKALWGGNEPGPPPGERSSRGRALSLAGFSPARTGVQGRRGHRHGERSGKGPQAHLLGVEVLAAAARSDVPPTLSAVCLRETKMAAAVTAIPVRLRTASQ
ncbi:Fanconi anemia group J protein [Manis javanica]|nr:Fanconi anemia group J protein [Manis javanica]